MISKNHSNRCAHNWLIYDTGDRFLEKCIPIYKGVLYDLGCGESPYKDFFQQYVDQYIGIDWVDSYHDIKADIVTDLNQYLPIKSAMADTIISLSVLEHLREPQVMLNEAFRIMKPGGNILLQVPWQWWVHEAPHDFFRYTPYALTYMFEKAGFTNVVVTPQSGFFTTVILKMNYFTARFIHHGPKSLRFCLKLGFTPFWYVGQKLAPLLDKLDYNWESETAGYYVTARKS